MDDADDEMLLGLGMGYVRGFSKGGRRAMVGAIDSMGKGVWYAQVYRGTNLAGLPAMD